VTLGNVDGEITGLTIPDPPIEAEVQALRDACEGLADADGHAEHWRWKNRKSSELRSSPAENAADLADLRRLQAAAADAE